MIITIIIIKIFYFSFLSFYPIFFVLSLKEHQVHCYYSFIQIDLAYKNSIMATIIMICFRNYSCQKHYFTCFTYLYDKNLLKLLNCKIRPINIKKIYKVNTFFLYIFTLYYCILFD